MRISFVNTLVISFALIVSLYLAIPVVQAQDVGATFCWHYKEIYGGHDYPYNQSIVTSNLPTVTSTKWEGMDQWWENMVEEVDYSGIDFIALLSRGTQPNQTKDLGTGDPKHIKTLVRYMNERNAKFKLCIFDDCPNSWQSGRNYNLYGKDQTKYELFDCGNPDNYKYIWDYNLKLAIENIPDERRYKINGRMVIIFWSVKSTWMTNMGNGNMKKIIEHIRAQCMATYGFNPYLILNRNWFDVDSQCNSTVVADAVHNWFSSAGGTSYTNYLWNGITTGVVTPGFGHPADPPFIDPLGGQTLIKGLEGTVRSGAGLTLCEGFTDAAESAAYWRSEDATYYKYPNQRLNILRRYTKNPYPDNLKIEAEACDLFSDITAGNSGGAFRTGDIDVVKTDDTNGGWQLTNTQPNEWMEWKELPLLANSSLMLRYTSKEAASVQFSVDGTALPKTDLPATNGNWATVNAGTTGFSSNSLHTVRLTVTTGTPEINYFTIRSASTTGTGTDLNQAGKPGFNIYPNPAGSTAIVSFRPVHAGNISFELYNAGGVCVKSLKRNVSDNGQQQMEIPVSDLKPGVYWVRYISGECKQTQKLLVK